MLIKIRKAIEDLYILLIGVNYVYQTHRVDKRHGGSTGLLSCWHKSMSKWKCFKEKQSGKCKEFAHYIEVSNKAQHQRKIKTQVDEKHAHVK